MSSTTAVAVSVTRVSLAAGGVTGTAGGAQVSVTNGLLGIGDTSCAGCTGVGGGVAGVSGTRLLAAGVTVSTGAGVSSPGSHPILRDLLTASKPPMRQSLALLLGFLVLAAGTSSVSAVPSGLQAAGSSSSSSTASISSSSRSRQSCSMANSGEFAAAKLESSAVVAFVVSVGVSSRLPNATGCEPESIRIGSGREGTSSTKLSLTASGLPRLNSCTGAVATAGTLGFTGGNISLAPKGAGSSNFAAGGGAWPDPERCSADFTIEISGSGGINGFFKTPSAPTLCASCSSKGSNAPTSRITGICDRAESIFTNWQTS